MATNNPTTAPAATAQAVTPSGAPVTITGAKKIRVTSAVPEWLQIAELQAVEAITGKNVALASNGGTAVGSGNYDPASVPGKAIDGIGPAQFPDIYHSNGAGADEFLEITLAAPANLASVTLFGRAYERAGRTERDFYNITILNDVGATLFSGQLDNRELSGGGRELTFAVAPALPPEMVTVEVRGQKYDIVTVVGNFRDHEERLRKDPWFFWANNKESVQGKVFSQEFATALKVALGLPNVDLPNEHNRSPYFANKNLHYEKEGALVHCAAWVVPPSASGMADNFQIPVDWTNGFTWATLKIAP